ncbi:unnamed protein product [Rhodiola kirilowii]
MQIISWNVRGVNGAKKQKMIRRLKQQHQLDMLFLQETKIAKLEEKTVSLLWGKEQVHWSSLDSVGRSGGLLTMWSPEFFQLSAEIKGRGFIHVRGKVSVGAQETEMNFINVYAPSTEKDKLLLWEELMEVRNSNGGGWIIGGDFNAVIHEEERRGSTFNCKEADQFFEFIQAMGVMDMPLIGRKFTWSNKLGASRLDRFLVSPDMVSLCPNLKQWGLSKDLSDHAAIALKEEAKNWGMKPFRFINAWLEHPGLGKLIKETWSQPGEVGWKGYIIQRKLAKIRRRLGAWNKMAFGNVGEKLKETKLELEKMDKLQEQRILSPEEQLRRVALRTRIWHLESQEERIWRQKSRVNWMRSGDQNTRFFHRMATWRSKKNSIESLVFEGRRVDEPGELKSEIRRFFLEQFLKKTHVHGLLKRFSSEL